MLLDIKTIRNSLAGSIDAKVYKAEKSKLAAVLVIIYGPEPSVVMTERPKTMGHHAGEISFPGGRWQASDTDLLATALRETEEELGAKIPRGQVIGQLDPVVTLNSGFAISPFITVQEKMPELSPNSEIESVLEIPLVPLLKTMENDRDPAHRSILEMYTFKFQKHLIWGASARMLHQIYLSLSANSLL